MTTQTKPSELYVAARALSEALDLPRAANVSCGVDVRHAHERLQSVLSNYKPEPSLLNIEILQIIKQGPKVSNPDSAINRAENNADFIRALQGMVE